MIDNELSKALVAQLQFNLQLQRTVHLIASFTKADQDPTIRQSIIDLLEKNGLVISEIQKVVDKATSGVTSG